MGFWNKWIFHSPKRYLLALAICGALTGLALGLNGTDSLLYLVNAFSVAGAATVFIGLLVLMSFLGAFDTFGYSFSTLGKRRYKDLYEYTAAKQEKRSHEKMVFVPYILVGALFLAVGLILAGQLEP